MTMYFRSSTPMSTTTATIIFDLKSLKIPIALWLVVTDNLSATHVSDYFSEISNCYMSDKKSSFVKELSFL